MRIQKFLGWILGIVGFISLVIMLALNIAGGSMERDIAVVCCSWLAVCGAGFSMAVGGERELPFVPHSLFTLLSAAAVMFSFDEPGFVIMLLLLVVLGCVSVCIYGRDRAHIIFSAVYAGLGAAGALLFDPEYILVYLIAGAVP